MIAQWTFNSREPDATFSTGTLDVSRGTGVAWTFGNVSESFASVASSATSDPDREDNSQLRLARFPAQGTSNKGGGIEFHISTVEFQTLRMSWDQYNSATASRFWRVQYTVDGGRSWVDHAVITNSTAATWRLNQYVSFRGITALNHNANAAVRIVPEFESTAAGAGAEEFRAVGEESNYSAAGTLWLDMVTFQADPLGWINTAPVVSPIADLLLDGTNSIEVPFTIHDAETPPDRLEIWARPSDRNLITNTVVTGSGTNRALSIQADAALSGVARIDLEVIDEDGAETELSFSVTHLAETQAPPPLNLFRVWNFNGSPPDDDPGTGELGSGAALIGGLNGSFGAVGGGRTSDPAASDNSMLRLTGFPAQGTGNQSAGLEFRASTAGKTNIALRWDQYNSATASRYWRVRVSTNGQDFFDHAVVSNALAGTWIRNQAVRFEGVAGVENNPNFAVRFVSEFESSAAGTGEDRYVAVSSGSNYSPAGTLWLDMVAIAGDEAPVTAPPTRPELIISFAAETAEISWPATEAGFHLTSAAEPRTPIWEPVVQPPERRADSWVVTVPVSDSIRVFRLER